MTSSKISPDSVNVVFIGATGLVGSKLLPLLINDSRIRSIEILSRRKTELNYPKCFTTHINFEQLDQMRFTEEKHIFISTLGTTLKDAGSKENFKHIDFDYNYSFAKLAEIHHAQRFMLVSSLGADPNSRFFYSMIKGQLEKNISHLSIPRIDIFRPSLLIGNRLNKGQSLRPLELLTQKIWAVSKPLWFGQLKLYQPIAVEQVANFMHRTLKDNAQGLFIHENHTMVSCV